MYSKHLVSEHSDGRTVDREWPTRAVVQLEVSATHYDIIKLSSRSTQRLSINHFSAETESHPQIYKHPTIATMMSVTSLQRSAIVSRSLRPAVTPLPVNRAMRIVRRTQEKTKSESGGDLTQDELKEVRADLYKTTN